MVNVTCSLLQYMMQCNDAVLQQLQQGHQWPCIFAGTKTYQHYLSLRRFVVVWLSSSSQDVSLLAVHAIAIRCSTYDYSHVPCRCHL
jgi:hypothetical protein